MLERLPRPPRLDARTRALASARRRRRKVPRPLRRRRRSELYWLEREHLVGRRWGPWRAVALGASVSTVPFAAAWLMSTLGASAPIAGLIGVAGIAGGVAAMMDRLHRHEALSFAIVEIARGRLDEAQWWAENVVPGRGKKQASEAVCAALLRADVAWRRGRFEDAQACLERAEQIARHAPRASACHWQLASRQAQIGAVVGDLKDSQRAFASLAADMHQDAEVSARFTALVVAFHTGDLRALPDELAQWVDESLKLAPGPVELALLTWISDTCGDRQRTADILARAGGSLDLGDAATRYPQLARWAAGFEPGLAYR